MPPPARGPAQADQARGLGGHAVGGHELLLLADRVEKAEGVRAEAHQRQGSQREQRGRGAQQHLQAFATPGGRKHQEGEHQPGGDLDSDARDHGNGGRAKTRVRAGGQEQRHGEQQQDQRVVVGAAHREHQQHRVQPHERSRPARGVAGAVGRRRDQGHGAETAGDRHALEDPQRTGDPERDGRVAREREQRTVGRMLEGPSHERVDRVGGGFGGDVGVWVQPVQRAHSREAQVAEDVLGDQRRPEEQDQVREHDGGGERRHRQGSRRHEHEHVARAHDQHQRLEAVPAEGRPQALKRPGQPARPPALAGGHEFRRFRRRVGAEQEDRGEHPEQPDGAQRAEHAARHP